MSYHSVQIHLAVTRLIERLGCVEPTKQLECNTVDLDGDVAYQVSAKGDAHQCLTEVLGDRAAAFAGPTVLTQADATRLMRRALDGVRQEA